MAVRQQIEKGPESMPMLKIVEQNTTFCLVNHESMILVVFRIFRNITACYK